MPGRVVTGHHGAYLEVHSFTRSRIFADDVAMIGHHVASVGKSCACWVSSGGVSRLMALYKDEDSLKGVIGSLYISNP